MPNPETTETLPKQSEWFIPNNPETPDSFETDKLPGFERTIFLGCTHGQAEAAKKLTKIALLPSNQLPDRLILIGDLPGQKNTERQKKLIYNYFLNRLNPIIDANPNMDTHDLLDLPGVNPPEDSPTIRDGAVKLLTFALRVMGEKTITDSNIEPEIKNLARWQMSHSPYETMIQTDEKSSLDDVLSAYIHWIREVPSENRHGLNSGTWVGTLPDDIRKTYVTQYKEPAEAQVIPLLALKGRGVDIIYLEGNEEMPDSLQAMTQGLENPFDTELYLNSLGITCTNTLKFISTETTNYILVPFRVLKYPELIPKNILQNIETEIMCNKNKKFVMVAHYQPIWEKHFPGQAPIKEPAEMIPRFIKLIERFHPDELIYSHQHVETQGEKHINRKFTIGTSYSTHLPALGIGMCDSMIPNSDSNTENKFDPNRQTIRRIS